MKSNRDSSDWLINSYDKNRVDSNIKAKLGPGKYEVSTKRPEFSVKQQNDKIDIFQQYFQQHIGNGAQFPNYTIHRQVPQTIENPGTYQPEKRPNIPSLTKKLKKARYNSQKKNEQKDLSITESWRYLDKSMMNQQNSPKKSFNRISLQQVKGAPTIPYQGIKYEPESLGPGKYDVKFEITEKNIKGPKIKIGSVRDIFGLENHRVHRKLPSVQDLKVNKHLGVSISRAQLEDLYKLEQVHIRENSPNKKSPPKNLSPVKNSQSTSQFKSKVERLPDISQYFPGPGEYNIQTNQTHMATPIINPIHRSRNDFRTIQQSQMNHQKKLNLITLKLKGTRESIEHINGPPKHKSALSNYRHIGHMASLAQERTFYRNLKKDCIDYKISELRLAMRNEPSPGPGDYDVIPRKKEKRKQSMLYRSVESRKASSISPKLSQEEIETASLQIKKDFYQFHNIQKKEQYPSPPMKIHSNSEREVDLSEISQNFSSQRQTQKPQKTQYSQIVNIGGSKNDSEQFNKSSEADFQTYNRNMNNINADFIFNMETPQADTKKVIVKNFDFNI